MHKRILLSFSLVVVMLLSLSMTVFATTDQLEAFGDGEDVIVETYFYDQQGNPLSEDLVKLFTSSPSVIQQRGPVVCCTANPKIVYYQEEEHVYKVTNATYPWKCTKKVYSVGRCSRCGGVLAARMLMSTTTHDHY